ncbi:hypothetical protein ACP70R_043034 [Stipagrostis hirtigluma subsp. patula]
MADVETLLQHFSRKEAPRRTPTHSKWPEVEKINNYAVFMGYMSMAVRGLGFLILTWTTVVLLGGFVSVLERKDFWCLTAITFAQAAGLFDGSRSKRLSNIGASFKGVVDAIGSFAAGILIPEPFWYMVLIGAVAMTLFQILVLTIILGPIFVLYVSGPYVPIWLAGWRLRHRDYGNGSGDPSSANLKVALDVLYILVVAQGTIAYFVTIYAFAGKSLVEELVRDCGFGKWASPCVWDYLADIRAGCAKDPSFARGRNLVTYAVDLIKSESAHRKLSGARVLDTLIADLQMLRLGHKTFVRYWKVVVGRNMVLKQLIIESDDIVQKLLQMLDSRSPYDKEMRKRAARIVAYLAGDIQLNKYPRGIHWVASLLDTFEEYSVLEPYQRDWLLHTCMQDWCQETPLATKEEDDNTAPEDGYKDLVLQGLHILARLATNEDNCVIISNTTGLLSKIMAPVTNNLVHSHGYAWSSIVEGSLRVMCQLVTAPGDIGRKLRSEISSNKKAITAMKSILGSQICGDRQRHKAIQTLTELFMDTSLSMDIASRKNFIKTLLDIFLEKTTCPVESDGFREIIEGLEEEDLDKLRKKIEKGRPVIYLLDIFKSEKVEKLDIGESAAQALMRLSFQVENSAAIILEEKDSIVNDLTALLLSAEQKTYRRVAAAVVLERLYVHYTEDGEYLKNLKKAKLKEALITAMPKVLKEILFYVPAEEMQTGTETNQVTSTDIETPCESEDNGNQDRKSQSNELEEKKKYFILALCKRQDSKNIMKHFIPSSLSLCVTVCETFISSDKDSDGIFSAITSECAPTSVPSLLKDMAKRNMDMVKWDKKDMMGVNSLNQAYCLKIVKLISRMVISMMKHGGNYNKEDLDSLMDLLSDASSKMSFLDASMVFASNEDGMLNHGEEKPRNLISLVKEAKELRGQEEGANASNDE